MAVTAATGALSSLDVFFYGTLCHPALLAQVLGREVSPVPARLADYAAFWAVGRRHPVLVQAPGQVASGVLLRGLTPEDAARLDFYEDGFAFNPQMLPVQTATAEVTAQVCLPRPGQWQVGTPWFLEDWQKLHGDVVTATAGDVMALYGQSQRATVLARYDAMLVRGAGRVRARAPAPTTLRRVARAGDVAVDRRSQPYGAFFSVEEYELRFRRFDGAMSPLINRAALVSGDAVTVLPYDPVRDRVLLIEQFRMGPYARGDTQPWMLEPIAGRIDVGETPEQAARREAVEEAGLMLGDLIPVARYYPSPAIKTEFLYSYVALCDLPDGVAGVFGAEDEAEDIRGHLMGFASLMEMVASGEVAVGPLVITALWLQRERARLRG